MSTQHLETFFVDEKHRGATEGAFRQLVPHLPQFSPAFDDWRAPSEIKVGPASCHVVSRNLNNFELILCRQPTRWGRDCSHQTARRG